MVACWRLHMIIFRFVRHCFFWSWPAVKALYCLHMMESFSDAVGLDACSAYFNVFVADVIFLSDSIQCLNWWMSFVPHHAYLSYLCLKPIKRFLWLWQQCHILHSNRPFWSWSYGAVYKHWRNSWKYQIHTWLPLTFIVIMWTVSFLMTPFCCIPNYRPGLSNLG